MMMYGEDNLGNMTSCLQPGGDSPSVSDAVPWGSQVTEAQAEELTRCHLLRAEQPAGSDGAAEWADDSGWLPEHHLSQFVPIRPNSPTAVPSLQSDDRPLFQRAQELVFFFFNITCT